MNALILVIFGLFLSAVLLYLRFSTSDNADKFRAVMTIREDYVPTLREGDVVDVRGFGEDIDCKMRIVRIDGDELTLEKP